MGWSVIDDNSNLQKYVFSYTSKTELLSLQKSFAKTQSIIEPQHEISNKVVCATSKGLDQPVHIACTYAQSN